MTRSKTIVISGPFDARHVGGVSVPGVTMPIEGMARASTSLEPDETPSHTFAATGNIEIPRRSNSIAHSLSRPSLRLKTSLSLLRGRSSSSSPDTHRRMKSMDTAATTPPPPQSLKKKSSSTRMWHRAHHESPTNDTPMIPERPERPERPQRPERPERVVSEPTEITPLSRKPSVVRFVPQHTTNSYEYHHRYQSNLPPPPPPPPPIEKRLSPEKKQPLVRPKRADSGTAIEFDDVSITERPLGFKEIAARSSFAERMELYKRTRLYWATADHGLGEWVDKAGTHRPLVFPV
ncbi:hypothetical protein P280DRAFT_33638 [Massarina eburnea CBS 473.64]|uniref:Uncharacterized protein n=1 Tax=Massarina eburnea CBS 473.64 TaxID=1395130 RepID=A0A6A6RXN4_9PLEO|nr:hypothetical protein P280DRAFT_33638 [Massarina eburnea CBS 473.64]